MKTDVEPQVNDHPFDLIGAEATHSYDNERLPETKGTVTGIGVRCETDGARVVEWCTIAVRTSTKRSTVSVKRAGGVLRTC